MTTLSGFLNLYKDIEIPLEDVKYYYVQWVKEVNYMLFRKKLLKDVSYFVVKCAKRGNDVYFRRVRKRFNLLFDVNVPFGSGLLITLTWDTKICSRHQAWLRVSADFNRFMARLRREFGSASSVRCFESFSNGYPHVHIFVLFKEFKFKVVKVGKSFRVSKAVKEKIAGFWHSFVDVKVAYNYKSAVGYIGKYVSKSVKFDVKDKKGLLTLALCWAYRKRAFSISKDFQSKISDLMCCLHNSNKVVQSTFGGGVYEVEVVLLAFVPKAVLGFEDNVLWKVLDDALLKEVVDWIEVNGKWRT